MPSLIFQIVSWPTLVIALLVFGFAPGAVLRLIVLAFPRDDPRRQELLGELFAVPRIERPFWVAQQLEVAFFEGLRDRFSARRLRSSSAATRTHTGWRVGAQELSDLTSAMVLADLLAADLPADTAPPTGASAVAESRMAVQEPLPDARKLQQTICALEQALTARVRVEQAIGVLVERHRLPPRAAFDLLRAASESRGKRVLEIAGDVVESSNNPEHPIPDELAKPPTSHRPKAPG